MRIGIQYPMHQGDERIHSGRLRRGEIEADGVEEAVGRIPRRNRRLRKTQEKPQEAHRHVRKELQEIHQVVLEKQQKKTKKMSSFLLIL